MAKKNQLKYREQKFVQFCEIYYFKENGAFPSPEQVTVGLNVSARDKYTISEINHFLTLKRVQEAFNVRGLRWERFGAQAGSITPTQVAAALTMTNFADPRTGEEKLSDLGITPVQYFAWLQDSIYSEYVNRIADKTLTNVRPEAMTEFAKLVRKGDLAAIKYYFEVTGQFNTQTVTEERLKATIQQFIEVIQRHVSDPQTLLAISQDLMNAAPVATKAAISDSSELINSSVLTGSYNSVSSNA